MLRVTVVKFFNTIMITFNLILFLCYSSVLAKLSLHFDGVNNPADIIKTFRDHRQLGKPIQNPRQVLETDVQPTENKAQDLTPEATAYGVRAIDNNRRRRGRRNNHHHHQFLGVKNIFGGRKRVPYKRLPAPPGARFRVGVHTPNEVRAY